MININLLIKLASLSDSYRNEFAYGSADKMVYIRKFSPTGKEMVLQNTLQGHENDVTCVKWNAVLDKWVTGSEDATIRVWVGGALNTSNAEATFVQSTFKDAKIFDNHPNPVILIFIRKLSLSTLR